MPYSDAPAMSETPAREAYKIEMDGVVVETQPNFPHALARACELGGFVRCPNGLLIDPVKREWVGLSLPCPATH